MKRPLYYFDTDQNELVELKSDRQSIGGFQGKEKSFTNIEILLDKGSKIYLITDGFMDQHNLTRQNVWMGNRKEMILPLLG